MNRHERRRQERINRSKASRPSVAADDGPVLMRDPFADLPREELKAAMLKASSEAKASLPETTARLEEAITQCDATYFLAAMTRAVLTAGVTDDGDIKEYKHKSWDKAVKHFHIEWAQALFAKHKERELSGAALAKSLHPSSITTITDSLFDLGQQFQLKRLLDIDATEEALQPFAMLQERIRLHTTMVRNWSYYAPAIETLKSIYGPLASDLRAVLGIDIEQLCGMFDFMVRRLERTVTDSFNKLRKVWQAPTREQLLATYAQEFGTRHEPSEVKQMLSDRKIGRNEILFLLLSHNDLLLARDLAFDAVELGLALGITPEAATVALNHFSLSRGSLPDLEVERLFLANPIWQRPILALDDQRYLCVMPQLFFDNAFNTLSELLKAPQSTAARHERRKADYLERRVLDVLSGSFPDNEHLVNAKWTFEGREYESDLLIRVDNQLFIVEAKSGRITEPALRGAPDRIRRHIEDLVIAPAIQSDRLANCLRAMPDTFVAPVGIDFQRVRNITRLAVTLEDFAALQSEFHLLTEAALVPQGAKASVTMSISDLTCVAEILDNPVELMHYLVRRGEIQQSVKYRGDELDLLGIYLKTGFNLGEVEKGEIVLQSVEMSTDVDAYFQGRDEGFRRVKPARKFTEWFIAIRNQLAENKPHGWTEAATALMRVAFDDQVKLEAEFDKITSRLRRQPPTAGELDTVVLGPPEWAEWGIAAIALRNPRDESRLLKMESAAGTLFEAKHVKRCVVLCRPTARDRPAYSTLVVLDRPLDAPE